VGSNFLGAVIQLVVGIVLTIASPLTAPAGVALIIGAVFTAAAVALTPDRGEATDERESPTYGFGQFTNPKKGDSPIPVVYSAAGHKIAPVWLQAFITPRGFDAEDDRKGARTQQLSGLLAIAEGPIEDISEIRFNDEPVFDRTVAYQFGVGNGSRTKWALPQNKIELDSVEVYEGATPRGFFVAAKSDIVFVASGTGTTHVVDLPDGLDDSYPIEFFNTNPVGKTTAQLETYRLTPQIWLASETQIFIHRDVPFPANMVVYMRYGVRATNGVRITKVGGNVEIKFNSAPASGVKLTASWTRKNIDKVKVSLRRGSAHQLPIWGFHIIRNSFAVPAPTLAQDTPVVKDTQDAVDDVGINIQSSANGMVAFDSDGDPNEVRAQFTIDVKRVTGTETAGGTNTFDDWYKIPDPRGADSAEAKNGYEFQVRGNTISQFFWTFWVRNTLQENARKAKGTSKNDQALRKAYSDFSRGRYSVRITRTNPVASTNNSRYTDDIEFTSITEMQDEALNLPGTALLGFHALGTERLSGGAPNVTLVVKGKRDVQRAVVDEDSPTGYSWNPASWENQSNRVWAAVDLITSWRFGAGDVYDRDVNIDLASAIECADWLDGQVSVGDNTSDEEVRSRLDIVLDTRKSLLDTLRDVLQPGRIWAVLRGDTFVFVKDDAVDLSAVPVIYDDTKRGRTTKDSLAFSHDTVVSRATEVQLTYLDEAEEFQPKEVWVVPEEPGDDPRRVRRVTAYGITRHTETSRYGAFLYAQLRHQGASMVVAAAPRALDFGAGGVIRVISNRTGIDGYWRIFESDVSTDNYFVKLEGRQYVPHVYAQTADTQRIITDGFTRLLAQPAPTLSAPAASQSPFTGGGTGEVVAPGGDLDFVRSPTGRSRTKIRSAGRVRARLRRTG